MIQMFSVTWLLNPFERLFQGHDWHTKQINMKYPYLIKCWEYTRMGAQHARRIFHGKDNGISSLNNVIIALVN